MINLSERIKNLGIDSIIFGVGGFFNKFIGLFILPFFTKLIEPKDYGMYSLIVLLGLIANNLFSFGQTSSVGTVYFRNSNFFSSEAIWGGVLNTFIGAFLVAILSVIFPEYICKISGIPLSYSKLVIYSFIGVAINMLASIFLLYFQLERKLKIYTTLTTLSSSIALILSYVLIVHFKMGVFGLVISTIYSGLFLMITSFVFLLLKKKLRLNRIISKELLYTGISFIPSNFIWFVLLNQNRYILQAYHGFDALGIYSVAYAIGGSLSIVTTGIANAWFPFFMNYVDDWSDAEVLFPKITYYYIILIGSSTLMLFAISNTLSLLLLDPRYFLASKVIGLIGTASFFTGLYNFLLPGVYFANEVRRLWIVQLLAIILGTPFVFLITYYFGLFGAAFSLSLSHIFMPMCLYIWIYYNEKIKFNIAFYWSKIGKYFLFFCFFQFLFIYISFDDLNTSIILAVLGILFVIFITIQFVLESEMNSIGALRVFKLKFK